MAGAAATTTFRDAPAGHDVRSVSWWQYDGAAPVVTFPGAPGRTAGVVRLPVRITDDTAPLGGLTVTCLLDGKPTADCRTGFAATLAAGTHTLTVTARDAHGRSTTASHRWIVDTAPPVVSVATLPGVALVPKLTLSYAATDPAGVGSYDVRYRRANFSDAGFSALVIPAGWAGTREGSRSLTMAPGYEYCLSVRARDTVGNVSAWSSERCTAMPLDDRAMVRTTAGWSQVASVGTYANTTTVTTSRGAALARPSAQGRRFAVVATTCPTCGSLDVFLGSTRIGSVSLVAPTTRVRQVLFLPVQASVRAGTVTLRTTSTGRRVTVDALLVRKR